MSKKILIIEDNPEVRENTAEILELAGYNVITAQNGREGVNTAQTQKPDLIICDIMMPVMDGYGVLLLLSKDEETVGIPFIFLTAKADRSDYRKGMEMGADDYLTKPYDDIELLNAVESRFRKNEILKKEFYKNLDGLNSFMNEMSQIDSLKKLTEERVVRTYKRKDNIYEEGQFARGVYFIIKGKVKTFKSNEIGKELITGLYKEGDFFGYLSLIEDEQYNDTATTLEDSEICMIPKEDFFELLYRNAEVSKKFIKILTDNLKEKEEQLIRLAYNSVRKRVAEALIDYYNKYKKDKKGDLQLQISRDNLANIVGTAPETAIRTLSDFKEEKLIDLKGSHITILNYDKLAGLKN
jgi:DNA-binding response OmpR family regulator